MRCRHLVPFVMLLLASHATAAEPSRDAAPMLSFSAGQLGIFDNYFGDPLEFGIAYRFRPVTKWALVPAFGATFHENDAYYVYVELRREFALGDRWLFTPSLAAGGLKEGKELDLGHDLEFRSGVELARRFDNDWRLGMALFHLSNGGIGDDNPGTEVLAMTLSIPVGKRRNRESSPIEPKRLSPSGS